jgi:hypothetical protein
MKAFLLDDAHGAPSRDGKLNEFVDFKFLTLQSRYNQYFFNIKKSTRYFLHHNIVFRKKRKTITM